MTRLLTIVLLGLSAAEVGAAEAAQRVQPPSVRSTDNDYWIGLTCRPLDAQRRRELSLPDSTHGLFVDQVVRDAPADQAGIRPGDILVEADGKSLNEIDGLIAAVQERGGEKLALKVHRGQEELTVRVEPEERPAHPGFPRGETDWDVVRRWLEQAERESPLPPMRFRFIHPGTILPPGAATSAPLPDDMTVVLTKQGNKPASVVVERGGRRWEVQENEIDSLPVEVRAYVERLLGRFDAGGGPVGVVPDDLAGEVGRREAGGGARVEERLNRIERRLDELLRLQEDAHRAEKK